MKLERMITGMKATFSTLTGAMAMAALLALSLAGAPQPAHALVKLGMLTCEIEGGTGLVLYSSKRLDCVYQGLSGKRTRYVGRITRVGLDLGQTNGGRLAWVVFALGDHRRGALEGAYVGASAEATVAAGIGANALIGGFQRSIVLQPVSVQGQTGISLAAGVAGMTLERR